MSNEAGIVGLQPCGLKRDFAASTETHAWRRSSSDARRCSHSKMFGHIPVWANTFSVRALVLQLEILIVFAPCHGSNVKIGVPENYDGIFPWYLTKVNKDILCKICFISSIWHGPFSLLPSSLKGLTCANVLLPSFDFNESVHVAFQLQPLHLGQLHGRRFLHRTPVSDTLMVSFLTSAHPDWHVFTVFGPRGWISATLQVTC